MLDVTAKTTDGKTVFQAKRIYMPQAGDGRGTGMVLGPDKKLGLIRDTSIQPFAAKEETFEIDLPPGVREANLEIGLAYQPRPGDVYPVHLEKLTARLDRRE